MSEDIFDGIIVGAGLAGSVAALVLAREGAQVLVIERGNSAGAKNVTGGRLYAHSLEHIIPGFADSAPVERLITHEKLAFMTEKSAMTMDYCNGDETSLSQRSYSVLRSKFDAWLMEQAEEAGAQLITGIRVDNLVQRDGKVVGVEADGDVIEAKTVLLADGVNSILAEKLGMAKRVKPTDVAVGVKELIELPKSVIEDRFQLQGNQGAACLFAGSPTDGLMGGGFLYTNENTLAVALSMAATPILLVILNRLEQSSTEEAREADEIDEEQPRVIIAGFGRFGQITGRLLLSSGVKMVVLDHDPDHIETLRKFGMKVFYGDATRMDLLESAGAAKAEVLINAIDDPQTNLQLTEMVKEHFPHLQIIARARDVDHYIRLRQAGVEKPERETFEGALKTGRLALESLGLGPYEARERADVFRRFNIQMVEEMAMVENDTKARAAVYKRTSAMLSEIITEDPNICH